MTHRLTKEVGTASRKDVHLTRSSAPNVRYGLRSSKQHALSPNRSKYCCTNVAIRLESDVPYQQIELRRKLDHTHLLRAHELRTVFRALTKPRNQIYLSSHLLQQSWRKMLSNGCFWLPHLVYFVQNEMTTPDGEASRLVLRGIPASCDL